MPDDGKMTWKLSQVAGFRRFDSRAYEQSLAKAPYWKQPKNLGDSSTEQLPDSADIVIVGSGFTGLSAALLLAREGRHVVVLDAEELGAGASTRNGGQIGSGNQKFRVKSLVEMFGEPKATALLREGVAMLDFIEEFLLKEGIDCHFQRCGRFRGAVRPEHYEAMARDMDDLRKYAGVESFAVPREHQHKEIGTDFFHGGSVLPDDASLHPGKLHDGMLVRAAEAGAQLFAHTPAQNIVKSSGKFDVTCKGGQIRAGQVLVATNGYTGHLDPYINKRIVQVQSSVITTEKVSENLLQSLMPAGRMYGNSSRVFFYFRAAPDEPRLIWGGRVGRLHKNGSPSAFSHLAKDLLRVFPAMEDVRVTHGWTGNIGYTFDDFPHLGKTPEGVHYAMGYCGTGVSRSVYFGAKIALQMLGSQQGATEFDHFDFPSHPFQAFAAAGVPAVETWYRIKDRFS